MGSTPEKIAVTGARLLLKQIFEFGFFHADPHPGNLRVLPSGVIVPLDYGMFGHLDIRTRERIAGLLSGLLSQDADRVIRALESLEIRRDHTDARGFRRDVAELVSAYSDLTPRLHRPGRSASRPDRHHPDPPPHRSRRTSYS